MDYWITCLFTSNLFWGIIMNKKLELTLLISVILISVFGLIMIYSASYIWADFKYGDALIFVKNQGLFL